MAKRKIESKPNCDVCEDQDDDLCGCEGCGRMYCPCCASVYLADYCMDCVGDQEACDAVEAKDV